MDTKYWYDLLAMLLEGIVPVIMIAFGFLIRNWLKNKGAKEEELALLETAYEYSFFSAYFLASSRYC